jgi:hypothetical protein
MQTVNQEIHLLDVYHLKLGRKLTKLVNLASQLFENKFENN